MDIPFFALVIIVLLPFNAGIELISNQNYSLVTTNKMFFRHLIVGVLPNLPYVKLQRNEKRVENVGGFVPDIIKWLAQKHKFTYDFVEPPDGAYGAFVNGSWNGLIGMICRGEIDLVGTDLSVTYARSFVVDFTYSYAIDPVALLVPYPRLASTISGVVRPFQYEVWIGILLSLVCASISLWIVEKMKFQAQLSNGRKHQRDVTEQMYILFRVLTNATEIFISNWSSRVLLATWCLTAFVLTQSYTSCLVAYLTAPKFIPFVNSVEELANNDDIVMVVRKYTSIDSDLAAATSGPLSKIGNRLKAHPERILENIENIEDMVAKEHKVVPWAESVQKITVHDDYIRTKECRLAIAKEFLYNDRTAFALPKSSSLTKIFNHDLLWMQQTGMLDYWMNSYSPKPNRCSAQLSSLRPITNNNRLTLNFLSSAFALFGVGIALSLTSFILEIIFQNC